MAMNGGRITEWRTVPAEPWRDHVEQMLRTWRCSHLNEDGDRLALDDFMDQDSIEDLIDFVCDERSAPAPVALTDEERQVRNLLAVIHRDGGHYAAEHGIAKACVDAIQAWYAPSDEVSRLTAERDALRAALVLARDTINDLAEQQAWADHWYMKPLYSLRTDSTGEYESLFTHDAASAWNARSATIDALRAEVTAWRERFPSYVYRPQDDCIERKS